MERYKKKFKESENSLSNLKDTSIVDKLYNFIYNNPYPRDEIDGECIHTFAKKENIDVHLLEEYGWAMLSVFICGGKAYDAGKTEKDFDPKFIADSINIEYEHLDTKTDNKVIKYIAEKFAGKIGMDHQIESDPLNYYDPYLKDLEDKIKNDKTK